jgi:glycosyltransferase involved in cell wall biosynthesis
MSNISVTSLKSILFVSFPVDLGNQTLENNFKIIFDDEMEFFRFAGDHLIQRAKKISFFKSVYFRVKSSFSLRKKVIEFTKYSNIILFQNLSPALFSYGIWSSHNAIIVLDWTRSLNADFYGDKIKRDIIYYIHKKIFNKCFKILCWTDASLNHIHTIYGIDKSKLYKVPAPFLLNDLSILPRITPFKPRVLFIGGDWKRKGGDVLLNAWETMLNTLCDLTILTSNVSIIHKDIKVITNIIYGSSEHKKIFEQNDILILPTRFDAYPQVIGEAAAAGLAVITTKFALGSSEVVQHGISGFVANSPEESINYLVELLNNHQLIDKFKIAGYNLMQNKFSLNEIKNSYLEIINTPNSN